MFQDRQDAGRALAKRLETMDPGSTVVLALPRGGVPVAKEICNAIGAPLDLILVRKIGVPGQRELAVGAIADGPDLSLVINRGVAASCGLSEDDVRALARQEQDELERRRKAYLGSRQRIDLAGKTAIIVDDGIATGATMKAAVKAARSRNAGQVVVAVPVAPKETLEELRSLADHVICLATPEPFWAVGQHYVRFDQVSDEEVTAALAAGPDADQPAGG